MARSTNHTQWNNDLWQQLEYRTEWNGIISQMYAYDWARKGWLHKLLTFRQKKIRMDDTSLYGLRPVNPSTIPNHVGIPLIGGILHE